MTTTPPAGDQRVTNFRRSPPSEESASRDAVGAIVDSICAATNRETNAARKVLDGIDTVMMQHASRIKAELEHFVTSIENVQRDTAERNKLLERIKSDHAQLVNARVAE
jgi:hypothetical protein